MAELYDARLEELLLWSLWLDGDNFYMRRFLARREGELFVRLSWKPLDTKDCILVLVFRAEIEL